MKDSTAVPATLLELIDATFNGTISRQQADELQAILENDLAACAVYGEFARIEAELYLIVHGRAITQSTARKISGTSDRDGSPSLRFTSWDGLGHAWNGAIDYLADHSWTTSYIVASLLFVLVGLIGWNTYLSSNSSNSASSGKNAPSVASQNIESKHDVQSRPSPAKVVGQITATVDCTWKMGNGKWGTDWVDSAASGERKLPVHENATERQHWGDAASSPSPVALGDKLTITAGLMEITYDTGAKVLLQGPCRFNIAENGGFLAVGRLTGKKENVHSSVGIAKPQAASNGRHNPSSLVPSPSFVIATPTAVITDLGTEFGVEVDHLGQTETQVFVGEVVAALVGRHGEKDKNVHLKAGQSTSIALNASDMAVRRIEERRSRRFVRNMPSSHQRTNVLFYDDASKETLVFGFHAGDWHGLGWRLGGARCFAVRFGANADPAMEMLSVHDQCWLVGPCSTAVRDFGAAMPVGSAFTMEVNFNAMSALGHSMGFSLCNADERPLFEFALENGQDSYSIHDREGKAKASATPSRNTQIPFAMRGLRLAMQRMSNDGYQLVILRLDDYSKYACQGHFLTHAGDNGICRIRFWNDNAGDAASLPAVYFNRLRVLAPTNETEKGQKQ